MPILSKQQVFAVCRYDAGMVDESSRFTVVKIMRSRMAAEEEEARLNALNAEKGAKYFVQVTRLLDN